MHLCSFPPKSHQSPKDVPHARLLRLLLSREGTHIFGCRGQSCLIPGTTGYNVRMTKRTLTSLALSIGLAASVATPALADGAASTRNIIIGGAAVAGTLLIINHNKKVHERYAQDARQQAQTASERNDAEAAYRSEQRAYQNEVALVGQYKREVSVQHSQILALRRQVAMTHSSRMNTAEVSRGVGVANATTPNARPLRVASTSYGWGHF